MLRYLLFLCPLNLSLVLLTMGCSKPILKMPEILPPIIKDYKHITYPSTVKLSDMVNTDIYLEEGDLYSIFSNYSNALMIKIGDAYNHLNQSFPANADGTGYLFVGFYATRSDKRPLKINLDIIVWRKEDYIQIADFFEKMKAKDPKNKAIVIGGIKAWRENQKTPCDGRGVQ